MNDNTIMLLEVALEKAKAGELTDIIIAGLSPSGMVYNLWSPTLDYVTRLGLIEDLKLTWYRYAGIEEEEKENEI